jgi:hypothetical protein
MFVAKLDVILMLDLSCSLPVASNIYLLRDQCVHDAFRGNETPMAGLTLSPSGRAWENLRPCPTLCK